MKNQKRVEELRELIDQNPRPVLSVFCRTDPRDQANSSETPAWAIALKNGLNHVAGFHEGNHGKEQTVKSSVPKPNGGSTGPRPPTAGAASRSSSAVTGRSTRSRLSRSRFARTM